MREKIAAAFAGGRTLYSAADYHEHMYVAEGDYATPGWARYSYVRDLYHYVVVEFCPHCVTIPFKRIPSMEAMTPFIDEKLVGVMGGTSGPGGMHYYFSNEDDAFLFKLTFY